MERYELPEGWEWTAIGDVATTTSGGTPLRTRREFYENGTIPWVKSGELEDNVITRTEEHITEQALSASSAKVFPLGTPLVALYGATVGKTARLGIDAATNQAVCAIFPAKSVLDEEYLLKWLRFQRRALVDQSVGGAQPNISQGIIRGFVIPLPPLAEQRRIVAQLDALLPQARDSRAALDRIPPLLRRARQAILAAAFRGDLTERDPADAPADALLARLRVERRARWEDDLRARGKDPATHAYPEPAAPATADLPELPQGWAWTTLKGLTGFLTSGSRGWAKHYASDGPVFLRVGDLRYDSIDLDLGQVVHVDPPESAERARTQVQTEDILITITGNTIGKVAVVPASLGEGYVNQHIALVRPLPDYDVQFVAWYLSSQEGGQKQIADTQYGMTKPGLSLTDVENLNVPFAPAREQRQIVARVKALLGQAEAIEAAVRLSRRRLDLAEQALLARAFRGELVPQDPTDEPAAALLARLHDAREAASRGPNTKGKRRERKQKQPTADVAAAVQGRSGV